MRFTLFIVAVFAVIALTFGSPVEWDEENLIESKVLDDQVPLVRHRRLTCDIFGSTPACAAHCIARGFRGGWCDARSVCNCRR